MKDFYKILGVKPDASADEIKRAFKQLAKKHHPDANPDNRAKSEEKFKEIAEAYEVLGHADSRREYDQQREMGSFSGFGGGFSSRRGGNPFGGGGFSFGSLDEILRHLNGEFGGNRRTGFGGGGRGGFSFGGMDDLFGGGQGANATLKVPLKVACAGGHVNVSGLPGGSQKVRIPPKSGPGSILTIQTSEGAYQLEVSVEDDPPFVLKGNQIETTISLNLAQAVLGSKVKMRDPSGEEIILTIPPGSQPGDKLRLRGLGFSGADLIVKLDVQMPKNLTDQQKQEFADLFNRLGLRY